MLFGTLGGRSLADGARRTAGIVLCVAVVAAMVVVPRAAHADPVPGGQILRIHVPEAVGGKTVIGQLTVDRVTSRGHVTAYPCDAGFPTGPSGQVTRSDVNYDPRIDPAMSNRLIVQADADGDVCFLTYATVELVVDINGVSFDTGISSFPNRRTDTRTGTAVRPGGTLRIHVPEAIGAKTVIGQLTADRATDRGHVTAYPCDTGLPTGTSTRSDLNYNGTVTPATSNRLIVQADADGDICLTPLTAVHLIVDINAAATDGGIFSFPNRRTDTRIGSTVTEWPSPPIVDGIPVWPPYTPRQGVAGRAALTGRAVSAGAAARPIVAVKVDNYRLARPHWGLDRADAVFEVEVEGVSRFVALFQSSLPDAVGPVRSARTGDLDLLTGMNRPVFAFSGANPGVTAWIDAADAAGVLVDFSALTHGCYERRPERPGPHDLSLDAACAVSRSPSAGPAVPLWSIADGWVPPVGLPATPDTAFTVPMPGVGVGWRWSAEHRLYFRTQDGQPHLVERGAETVQIAASTVVEVQATYQSSIVDARSPHVVAVGSGAAVIHRDGRAFPATWTRASPYEPFVFRSGEIEIPLDAGVTWIEMTRA